MNRYSNSKNKLVIFTKAVTHVVLFTRIRTKNESVLVLISRFTLPPSCTVLQCWPGSPVTRHRLRLCYTKCLIMQSSSFEAQWFSSACCNEGKMKPFPQCLTNPLMRPSETEREHLKWTHPSQTWVQTHWDWSRTAFLDVTYEYYQAHQPYWINQGNCVHL